MNKRRLNRLIGLLRKDAANPTGAKFDLGSWAYPSGNRSKRFDTRPRKMIAVNCGTSACAMGLAAISGEFEKEGLSYEFGGFTGSYNLRPILTTDKGQWSEFDAAEELFGLTPTQAEYLFMPSRYKEEHRTGAKGERYVANRIAKLIRDNGKIPHGVGTGKTYEQRKLFREHYDYPT